jgi:hypothetical protein
LGDARVSSAKPFAQLHQVPGLVKGQLGVFVCLEHKDSSLETVHISSDTPSAKLRTCLPAGEEGDRVACSRSNCVQILPVEMYNSEEMAIQAANEQCLVVCEDDWHLNINDLINNVSTSPKAALLPSICMFLRKRIMTPEDQDLATEGQERHKKYWTRERVKDKTAKCLSQIPDKYKEDVLDLLMEHREVFVSTPKDLYPGCSKYLVDEIIPPAFSLHSHPHAPSSTMRPLFARIQQLLINEGLVARAEGAIKTSNAFFLVLKNVEGAKYPASAEAVDELSDEDLRRYYRIIPI